MLRVCKRLVNCLLQRQRLPRRRSEGRVVELGTGAGYFLIMLGALARPKISWRERVRMSLIVTPKIPFDAYAADWKHFSSYRANDCNRQ